VKNLPNVTTSTTLTIDDLWAEKWETDDINKWQLAWNNNILYFGNPEDNSEIIEVVVDSFGWEEHAVSWNKTIVVVGWNIYIKDSLYYINDTDMLWLIALKDEQWRGGNIYIDPEVTNIVGTIYAGWSLISYDGVAELSWNVRQDQLKNQLHIFGSVFSENTTWGSVRTTGLDANNEPLYTCPYNISEPCTKDIAQRYDLNYLRRYQLYAVEDGANTFYIPVNDGKVSGNKKCNNDNDPLKYTCADGGTDFEWEIDFIYNDAAGLTNLNVKYPVFIEYNPQLNITPPPLFSE